jgi:conserved hypothetical protein, YceG family
MFTWHNDGGMEGEMSSTVSKTSNKYKPKKKRKAAKWLLVLLFLVALTVICAIVSYNYVIKNNISSDKEKEIVIAPGDELKFVIPKGANTTAIATLLKEQGLIKNEDVYKLISKFNGYDGKYQSGTHIISRKLNYDEIMRVLTSKPESRQVTIPEGKTFKQIVDILYSKNIITDKEKFIEVANNETFDYDFLKDLPVRDNKLEGYLFPDTYEFDMNATEKEIITRMLDNFQKKFKPAYTEKITTLKNMSLDKIIILASIIEKEAKVADERYTISGVLYNRLNNKDKTLRKLQVDATIQYILLKKTGEYKERLLYDDLQIDDPYNTYKYEGLPPGPICCPGEAAIRAALYPEEDTPYLYYVAKGDGSHEFSRTYKEHQAAIKKYGPK